MMSLAQVCDAVGGELMGHDVMLENVAINTREDCSGRLFVALKGENFDAHEFVEQAKEAGAAALMVEREVDSALPVVKVTSTHQALKDLATWWRSQFVIPVLAITGSVGKTTVKEMLGSIASEIGEGVVTQGNLNNEIGVPLTLMRLSPRDQYAVVEMGMNSAGEIERLTAMARPTVALVNNAAAAHLEGLGTIKAVAKAKGEIFSGLNSDGVAIINADDQFAEYWKQLSQGRKIVTFGLNASADVCANYDSIPQGLKLEVKAMGERFDVRLNSLGKHSVYNALAAIATAVAANFPVAAIVAGLEKYQPVAGRLNPSKTSRFTLFDDTYNANPASMQAAIHVLAEYENNLLIVGDMAELGESSALEHVALGEFAASHGVDQLWACGKCAAQVAKGYGAKALMFDTQEQLMTHLREQDLQVSAVLVKGSRSARMETVVAELKSRYGEQKEQISAGNDVVRGVN